MATREGSGWSRTWGAVAMLAFALHLGAALYELVVVFPLWSADLPKSAAAWAAMTSRPDSSRLFTPLVIAIVFSTAMAWISGLFTRGWRRAWLTLALAAAGATVMIAVTEVSPVERELFGPAALGDGNGALVVGLAGDWIRVSAMRMAALAAGAWFAWRAQATTSAPGFARDAEPLPGGRAEGRRGARRPREFSLGDLAEPEISFGDDSPNPRRQWQGSLPARRRTAKK